MKIKFISLLFSLFFYFVVPAQTFAVGFMDISDLYVRNDRISFITSNLTIPVNQSWGNIYIECTGGTAIYTSGHGSYNITNVYVPSTDYVNAYNNAPHTGCQVRAHDGTNNFWSNQVFDIPTMLPSPTPANTSPAIGSLPNSTVLAPNIVIGATGRYFANSSFFDSDSTFWIGTVDYGDGGGSVPLQLNSDKTFTLDHNYLTVGTYTITVTIIDNQNASGTGTAVVTIVAARTFNASNVHVTSDHIEFDASDFSAPPNVGGFNNAYIKCTPSRIDVIYTSGHGQYLLTHPYISSSDYAITYNNEPYSTCYINVHDGTNNFYSNQTFDIPIVATIPTPTNTPTPTPTPAPVTVTFNASADTYVKSGQDNRNIGGEEFMRIQSTGSNRSFVKFDQNAIEAAVGEGTILSATLQVAITDNGNNWGTTGRTVDIHRIIADWVEGDGTENDRGTGSGATWNCAIDSIIENQSKNCGGVTEWEMGQPNNPNVHPWVASATDSKTITNNQSGIVEYDVSSDIAFFMSGAFDNYGWIIKKTNEGQNGSVSFGTRESSSVPQLVVTYQP